MFTKKAIFIIGFFIVNSTIVFTQEITHFDSLAAKYASGDYEEADKLLILRELAEDCPDPDRKLSFSEELISAAQSADSNSFIYAGYLQKGNALKFKSDLSKALESYFEAAKIAKTKEQAGSVDLTIADVYSVIGNHSNAVSYYQNAINILQTSKDSVNVATALYNLGDEYLKINKLDSAWANTKEAEKIFSAIGSDLGVGYCFGNTGVIYSRLGKDKLAEENLNKAIQILQQQEAYDAICEFLVSMSDIYHEKGNDSIAKAYALRSLNIAKKYGLKEQVSGADLKLSQLYEDIGDHKKSLLYYKEYITYRDSVKNIQLVEQMADLRTNFEVSKKQVQVDLLNQQKKNQQIIVIATIIALILIALLAIGLHRRNTFMKKTSAIIKEEQLRSEKLLLNILPAETAVELKQTGKVLAKKFESVTVLFTDFVGFTSYAENLSPEQIVETVDCYFSKFDEIIDKYGLEKIKTIGDSYMCASGLPFHTNDHAFKITKAAFEIAAFVKHSKEQNDANRIPFDIRIGINTGPVVAGVVGSKKFAYDIWGDAVNIASRMESNSAPGRINISENTYAIIKNTFTCEYRGEIDVKNHGKMKMYFVNGTT